MKKIYRKELNLVSNDLRLIVIIFFGSLRRYAGHGGQENCEFLSRESSDGYQISIIQEKNKICRIKACVEWRRT